MQNVMDYLHSLESNVHTGHIL